MATTGFAEKLTRLSEHALASLKVRSALDPCLWLAALALPSGLIGASFSSGYAQVAWITLAFIPVIACVAAFLYLVITNPDKLRSETFELKKMALGIIEEKGISLSVSEDVVEAISNPDYSAVPKLTAKVDDK